jgi:sec-independent protein translocase protein TatA
MNEPTTYLAILSEWHIILLVLVIFLLFGGKKLPELARGLGEAMREFKRASREDFDGDKGGASSAPRPSSTTPQKTDAPTNKTAPHESSGGSSS